MPPSFASALALVAVAHAAAPAASAAALAASASQPADKYASASSAAAALAAALSAPAIGAPAAAPAAATTTTAFAASSSLADFCFDPETRHVCVSGIALAAGNWSWTMTCRPLKGEELDWCGIGFHVDSAPPPPPGSHWPMFPSEVIVLQVIEGGGEVVLEDRFARMADQPDCNEEQLTYITAFEVDPAPGGALRASLTRPALVSDALLAGGFTNLNRTVALVGAVSSGNARQTQRCGNDNFFAHDRAWGNTTLDMALR